MVELTNRLVAPGRELCPESGRGQRDAGGARRVSDSVRQIPGQAEQAAGVDRLAGASECIRLGEQDVDQVAVVDGDGSVGDRRAQTAQVGSGLPERKGGAVGLCRTQAPHDRPFRPAGGDGRNEVPGQLRRCNVTPTRQPVLERTGNLPVQCDAARELDPAEDHFAQQVVAEHEPALNCTQALWSPTTGIVDSHAFMLGLLGDLERAGGALALRSKVLGASFCAGRAAVVRVASDGGDYELEARCVVNAAGLHACALARQFDGLDPRHVPRERFAKGSYFTLSAPSPFSCLVYPAPVDAWLGVHVTLDLGGQLKFGPDLEWLEVDTPEQIDYRVDAGRAVAFEAAIRRYWPGLPAGSLQPAYSGVRPKIHGPGQPAPDFRLDGPALHGVAGLLNLFGVESPGLTASMAIAEEVRALLGPR